MATRIAVATFTDGEFDELLWFNDFIEARGFSNGFCHGASRYGAGSTGAYLLPTDLREMKADEDADEAARALKAAGLDEHGEAAKGPGATQDAQEHDEQA